jgi:hypothetical protein
LERLLQGARRQLGRHLHRRVLRLMRCRLLRRTHTSTHRPCQ